MVRFGANGTGVIGFASILGMGEEAIIVSSSSMMLAERAGRVSAAGGAPLAAAPRDETR